jgi:hypothetical protein
LCATVVINDEWVIKFTLQSLEMSLISRAGIFLENSIKVLLNTYIYTLFLRVTLEN